MRRGAGYLISGAVQDVSDNLYLDEQHDYDAGTICSVAETVIDGVCAAAHAAKPLGPAAGRRMGLWLDQSHPLHRPRQLPHPRLCQQFRAGVGENAGIRTPRSCPQEPTITCIARTFNAFELNSATIERFANNLAVATGGFRHAAVQENGTVTRPQSIRKRFPSL